MAIMVAVPGSVIGHFSNTSAVSHLPMLALNLTAWTSGVVLDATTALQNWASLIKNRALLRRTCTSIINLGRGRIVSTVQLDAYPTHQIALREKRV